MKPMNSSSTRDATSRESAEWKAAWEAVSRLAAAQPVSQQHDDRSLAPPSAGDSALAGPEGAVESVIPINPDEYARAIAEIEQASAALRRAQPTLETWQREPATTGEARKSHSMSVWLLVSGIWLSTVTAFAGAIGAILYLLG